MDNIGTVQLIHYRVVYIENSYENWRNRITARRVSFAAVRRNCHFQVNLLLPAISFQTKSFSLKTCL